MRRGRRAVGRVVNLGLVRVGWKWTEPEGRELNKRTVVVWCCKLDQLSVRSRDGRCVQVDRDLYVSQAG